MELKGEERGELSRYVEEFSPLIGDVRTEETFEGTIEGIIDQRVYVVRR